MQVSEKAVLLFGVAMELSLCPLNELPSSQDLNRHSSDIWVSTSKMLNEYSMLLQEREQQAVMPSYCREGSGS